MFIWKSLHFKLTEINMFCKIRCRVAEMSWFCIIRSSKWVCQVPKYKILTLKFLQLSLICLNPISPQSFWPACCFVHTAAIFTLKGHQVRGSMAAEELQIPLVDDRGSAGLSSCTASNSHQGCCCSLSTSTSHSPTANEWKKFQNPTVFLLSFNSFDWF